MRVTTEVCVASVEEAAVAAAGGVDHIEACAWLECGGVTPSIGLVRAVANVTGLPVRVLVRPTPGHFMYGAHDRAVLLRDVEALSREPGVHGVVTGALDTAGMPDRALMAEVIAAVNGREVTFHRAIDQARDPEQALAVCLELGIQRVLTSAGAARAFDAKDRLRRMVAMAGDRSLVAAGAGVAADHVVELVRATGVREVHFSARRSRPMTDPTAQGRIPLASIGEGPSTEMVPDPLKVAAILKALQQAGLR